MERKHLIPGLAAVALTFSAASARAADGTTTPATPDSLTNVEIDGSIIDTIDRYLPEREAIGSEFLSEEYTPILEFNADSQASVTFISEGAGYRNSLGYFSYDDGAFDGMTFSDIDIDGSGIIAANEVSSLSGINNIGMVFGNASGAGGWAGSGGTLNTGDTWVIGDGSLSTEGDDWAMSGGTVFEADTNMGFFLMANAWDGTQVQGWDTDADPATYWSLDFLNPENLSTATIDDVSGDTRHVGMLDVAETGDVILGFEDLNRATGDNDFNDAVFIVRSDPVTAFQGSAIPTVSAAPVPVTGTGFGSVAILGVFAGFCRRRIKRMKAR